MLYDSVADRHISSQIWHCWVWHRVCPQALAEALKVNKTVTNIHLGGNEIGDEGAKAWCLERGSVATGHETVKYNGIKWCTSGVRDLWDFSGVGRLFRCWASESFQKSHWNGMETRWKWDGGGCCDTCKARQKFQYYIISSNIMQYLVWAENSPWLRLVILASNFWWWTWLYVSVADRLVSSQIFTWSSLTSFLSTGPCWSIQSQQDGYEHQLVRQWNWQGRSQGLVLGTGVCGSRPRNGEIKWNQVVYQ